MSLPREALEQTTDWLEDLLRQGLSREDVTRPAFWHEQAARLTDAKYPGLARRLRRLCIWPPGDMSWAPVMLIELGRLHLLIQAALQFAELPAEVQNELTVSLRPAPKRETLIGRTPSVEDAWLVIGRRISMEPLAPQQRMRVAETWLLGREGGRLGLHVGFSPERSSREKTPDESTPAPLVQPLGGLLASTPPGTPAHFISSLCPQRLLFREPPPFTAPKEAPSMDSLPWAASFAEVSQSLLANLEQLPWLEQHPFLLKGVMPLPEQVARVAGCFRLETPFPAARWVADGEGNCSPVSPLLSEDAWWRWLAQAQQYGPSRLFGVLDPAPYVLPYSIWSEGETGMRSLL